MHLLYWLLALIFWSWLYTGLTNEYVHTLIIVGIVALVSIGTVYFFNKFLIPRYLFAGKYWKFGLFSFYSVISSSWVVLFLVFVYFMIMISESPENYFPFQIDVAFILAGMYLVIIAGVLSHVIRGNFETLKERNSLEKNQLEIRNKLKETELRFLKSQFHPHFLFNTLNNLYALSLKKADETPDMILKLSELLDYSLYGSEKEKVSISEEIIFIQNYLDLIRMRFQDHARIEFRHTVENSDMKLSPLLLIPFVENAVKHGIFTTDQFGWIKINLEQKGQHIKFELSNAVIKDDHYGVDNGDTMGLGLSQIRSRLNILYPDKHDLLINKGLEEYSISLDIYES